MRDAEEQSSVDQGSSNWEKSWKTWNTLCIRDKAAQVCIATTDKIKREKILLLPGLSTGTKKLKDDGLLAENLPTSSGDCEWRVLAGDKNDHESCRLSEQYMLTSDFFIINVNAADTHRVFQGVAQECVFGQVEEIGRLQILVQFNPPEEAQVPANGKIGFLLV